MWGKRHCRPLNLLEQICNLISMYRNSIYMVVEDPGHALYVHFPI